MCKHCLKEPMPNRERICLETGAYLVNFAGCHKCKKIDFLDELDRLVESGDEDGNGEESSSETISFKHACKSCGHVVATHEYSFEVCPGTGRSAKDLGYQEYSMECLLCGHGEARVSVAPDDQRKMNRLL
eukprot:Nk52_evm64s2039 gene=Nk52_evmTU64s2039